MNLPKANILYVGEDNEFFESFSNQMMDIVDSASLEFFALDTIEGDSFEDVLEIEPNLFILDFDFIRKKESIKLFLRYYKSFEKYQSSFFLGVFTDNCDIQSLIYDGLNFSCCKNNELEHLSSLMAYLVFGEKVAFKKFAKADCLNLETSFLHPAGVGVIDEEYLMLGSDIIFKSGLSLNQDLLEPNSIILEPIEYYHTSSSSQMGTYKTKWPIRNHWDNEGDGISDDSFGTFFRRFKTENPKVIDILSIGIEEKTAFQFLKDERCKNVRIRDSFGSFENFKNEVFCNRPNLILINYDKFKDGSGLDLETYFEHVKNVFAYKPIFLIFNSPSTTSALSKLFCYDKLIVFNTQISFDVLSELVNLLISKEMGHHSLIYCSNEHTTELNVECKIKSISEHEFIFESPEEIPYYTILRVPELQNLFLLIVPPYYETKKVNDTFTYIGVVFGMNDLELQSLRFFINQIIFEPIEKFDSSIISSVLDRSGRSDEGGKKNGQDTSNIEDISLKSKEKSVTYKLVVDKNWKSKI